ncbi:MAG: response regulator [Spirochaetes bacterium]|jgi:CheY-like chemotaxis protein/HPt (histidine-containing phosphotransfer) domain-containing protein|nr:response regulator [Spirochaetota bacterium]
MSTDHRATRGDVLVVEDNRINSVVTRRLVARAGFVADAAYSGTEAIDRLSEHSYSLVLMDLQLPDMTGVETARAIREDDSPVQDRSVPIVAVTAYADADDREACSAAGIDTVVEKPIDDATLGEVLRRYVAPREPGPDAARLAARLAAGTSSSTGGALGTRAGAETAFVPAELEARLGSERLARTVVSRFLDIIDERHAAVKAALASGDAAAIRAAAHSLAGPAANSGAPALHALIKRMEAAAAEAASVETEAAGAEAETEAGAVIGECAEQLDAEVERTRGALEEYLG